MTASINASTSSGVVVTSDTSGNLAIQSNGTTVLTATSTGLVAGASIITSGTAVASTSGTSIDFTSIPSWVKRVTVMFNETSTNGSAVMLVQLGTSGTPATSGYLSTKMESSGSGNILTSFTNGHGVVGGAAANVASGQVVFCNVSGNIWVGTGSIKQSTSFMSFSNSSVTLGGVLNMLRITTVNGTDTFDAGSINIQYE